HCPAMVLPVFGISRARGYWSNPRIDTGAPVVSGSLRPEAVHAALRASLDAFQRCYEGSARTSPLLSGMVNIRFTVERDGSVSHVADTGSNMPPGVRACVVRSFHGVQFPSPEGGAATV